MALTIRVCISVKLSPPGKRNVDGRTLHGAPLGQLHQLLQLGAGPVAEVALQQALVDVHLQAAGLAAIGAAVSRARSSGDA